MSRNSYTGTRTGMSWNSYTGTRTGMSWNSYTGTRTGMSWNSYTGTQTDNVLEQLHGNTNRHVQEQLHGNTNRQCAGTATREHKQTMSWNGNTNMSFLNTNSVLDRLRFLPIKKMDQRTCIKFCVKNEIKCADAFRMLTVAYGEATLDRSNVYRWYKKFSEGREDVNDEERAGRPSTSTTDEKINEVEKMILANRRITVREVAEDLNISIGSCHSIFINDLGMRRVAAKFVQKLLNCDQKQHRMNIANEMLDSVRDDPNLLQRVITGDEAWVYGYDKETKAQSSQWMLPHEPRPKRARQVRSNVKVLLTVFFDCRGVVHREFLPQGRTVNKEYYLSSFDAVFISSSVAVADGPSKAEQKPARHGEKAQQCAELSKKEDLQKKASNLFNKNQGYANPPADGHHANPATPTDFVTASFSEAAAQANRSWADLAEDQGPGEDDNFTVVKSKKRRRDSPGSPTAATSSGNRGAGATRWPRSSTGWAPRAEEVRTTQAHIAEARARQASSTEDHCVYVERSPELEPYHYIRAIDRMFGSTMEVFQVTKMNGHFLVGLANKGMAERLVNEGLEVEGTLHRAFPFRKRAERITVGNLPFFVGDAAVISALSSFGRVTSIAPKLMKAGPYVYNDGRREAFIILRDGMTIERLPTRLDISIKGEAWPAYLSSGIRCSRCRGQGHRRANCPMLAGRTTAPGPAAPTSPTSVPPATAPRLPQQPSARPPPPASPSSTMEVSDVPPASRAAPLPPAALQPSPPAPSALPLEDAPPAPPPVTPAPSLRTPGSREPAAPTPDVEMSIAEETSAFSTSSLKNATRVDLDAFIEKHPSVSFAGTDALGLGREEVLDLLSSRTKAQRKGPLLSPPRCDALAGLIGQILDLRPGAARNLYKVLGQVRAELRTTPAVPPTPPLPAPRPAETAPPAPHGEESAPAEVAYPPSLPVKMTDGARKKWLLDLFKELNYKTFLVPLLGWTRPERIIHAALHSGEERNDILGAHPNQRSILANFLGSVIERARGGDQYTLDQLLDFRSVLSRSLFIIVNSPPLTWVYH
ncbi:hypothetical protein LAZ67_8002688 [Cordylochernes scorpioides]|uniref:Mos1 transposase HTH domain-containing protein n=1 Tax=Cordylochernes scorpioides TaxID=51811 RepID=A0ABY6KT29_9ARAC|nr:hypothetical protein LAZ67_8002688 [Cordylochernes scorpioides]